MGAYGHPSNGDINESALDYLTKSFRLDESAHRYMEIAITFSEKNSKVGQCLILYFCNTQGTEINFCTQ